MAHIIKNIAVMPRITKRTQILSCFGKEKVQICQKDIYDSEKIQQKINKAAEVRNKLDLEIADRNNNLAKINFLG